MSKVHTMELIVRLAADETLGDRVIKVNHAGEHGAVKIYRAQFSITSPRDLRGRARPTWPAALSKHWLLVLEALSWDLGGDLP